MSEFLHNYVGYFTCQGFHSGRVEMDVVAMLELVELRHTECEEIVHADAMILHDGECRRVVGRGASVARKGLFASGPTGVVVAKTSLAPVARSFATSARRFFE